MATPLASMAIPGQNLAPVSSYSVGPGTHVHHGMICASIAGPVIVDRSRLRTKMKPMLTVSRTWGDKNTGLLKREVSGVGDLGAKSTKVWKPKFNTLPAVDSLVLARVTRVQKRQATVSILVILEDVPGSYQNQDPFLTFSGNDNIAAILNSAANPEHRTNSDELRFQALIRKEDVRAVEKDRVVMEDMFRVGDIVRGTVVSLGDQSFYYLTTARNELGVVMARSEAGNMMFPISWREMRDPATGTGESRKVARPF